MQPLTDKKPLDLESEFHFGPVRSPIQCEGIERGHRRIAEIAVSGSVNPQFNWADLSSPPIINGWDPRQRFMF